MTPKQTKTLDLFLKLLTEIDAMTKEKIAGVAFDIGYERGYAVGYNKGLEENEKV